MPSVLIIEDEELAAKRLIRLLKELAPDMNVLTSIDTVTGAVQWLSNHQADLIFLDIHLADGDSFSIFDQIDVKIPIIFTTAYDQYAIRAFKLNSIDYLLKPIDKEELAFSIEKFRQAQSSQTSDFSELIASMKESRTQAEYQKRFMVTSGEKIKSIPIDEVAYFFGQQKYVFLITKDHRRHIVDFTLGKLEGLLDPNQFYRINRQFIISFNAIQNMFSYSKSRVKIELDPPSDIEAIVSIEKAKRFKEWLNR
ncbi:MAG: LytTR family DNA-binding domain-containing protein [Bacteroidota bacterium]